MNRFALFLVLFATFVAVVAIPQYNPKPIQLSEGSMRHTARQTTEALDGTEGAHVMVQRDADDQQDPEPSKEDNTLTSEDDEYKQNPEVHQDQPAAQRSGRQLGFSSANAVANSLGGGFGLPGFSTASANAQATSLGGGLFGGGFSTANANANALGR